MAQETHLAIGRSLLLCTTRVGSAFPAFAENPRRARAPRATEPLFIGTRVRAIVVEAMFFYCNRKRCVWRAGEIESHATYINDVLVDMDVTSRRVYLRVAHVSFLPRAAWFCSSLNPYFRMAHEERWNGDKTQRNKAEQRGTRLEVLSDTLLLKFRLPAGSRKSAKSNGWRAV